MPAAHPNSTPAPHASARSAATPLPVAVEPWHTTEQAAPLIADLAANPPRRGYVTGILGPNDGAVIADDDRMRALERLFAEAQREMLARCDAAKDWAEFYAMVRPADAVAAAVVLEDAA